MADKEPAGLDMTLDDMIRSSQSDSQPQFRGGRGFAGGRGRGGRRSDGKSNYTEHSDHVEQAVIRHCFDCMRDGIRTKFYSKQALDNHKAFVHGTVVKRKSDDASQMVEIAYTWKDEGTPDESVTIELDSNPILQISASGDVSINGNVRHLTSVLHVMGTCLSPLGYKIVSENHGDAEDDWILTNNSGWRKVIDGNIKISAFPRRVWPNLRPQLKALPSSITVAEPTNFVRNYPAGVSSGEMGYVMGMNPVLGMPMGMGGRGIITNQNPPGVGPYMGYPMMPMMMQMSLPMMMAQAQAQATMQNHPGQMMSLDNAMMMPMAMPMLSNMNMNPQIQQTPSGQMYSQQIQQQPTANMNAMQFLQLNQQAGRGGGGGYLQMQNAPSGGIGNSSRGDGWRGRGRTGGRGGRHSY